MERDNREYEHVTVKQALRYWADWKIGVFMICYFISSSSSYSVAFFMPVILSDGMGFDYSTTLLLSTPPWVGLPKANWSDRYKLRWPVLVFQCLNAVVGLLLILYVKVVGVRLFGVFLATYGAQSNVPTLLTYAQNNTGDPSRRGVVSAAVLTAGAIGGVCGSTIFRSQDAPQYFPGMWTSIGMQLLYIVLVALMALYYRHQNKLLDLGKVTAPQGLESFRYTL
ncbi:uncharacterized protein E0L32_006206 [Thyridium curvatum]|uniref:Uncharacterized protein n=1 Tax=Thyridium curvatum TaxID=1093900 RepID=A0A507B330_9PEZI|nr:uncharacterized protein E0L32_006206 [Thyridium curvatum]TPX13476.1 hypothetical protein E0L32_006206 [Thyridium curvatum]